MRKRMADEQGVPAYVIFNNQSLHDMALKTPRTLAEFARISGVGEAKLRDFSGPFIEVIKDYVKANNGSLLYDAESTDIQENRTRIVVQSFLETGRIISEGATISEAAEQRGLKETTVLGHLERLVQEGEDVSLDHLLPSSARMKAITEAFDAIGSGLLRPVFDELGGEVSYEELRLVRLTMEQKGMMHLRPNN